MNYKPTLGWWFFGATTAAKRAERYSSWGLYDYAVVPSFNYYNHIYLQMYLSM